MKSLILHFARLLLCGYSQLAYAQSTAAPGTPESVHLLSQYIQHPSVSGHEKKAGEFFARICKEKGLFVELFNENGGGYNFTASLYPLQDEKPNIIFLNHIDVVPAPPDSSWKFDPFAGTIQDGIVWGRGAIDMKGMAVMQLLAIDEFKKSNQDELPFNITLLCVSREETDNGGAKSVIDGFLDLLNPIVVFGEGGAGITGLSSSNPNHLFFTISVAEKKALWLKLSIKIPSSGHGAVPPLEYTNQVLVKSLGSLLDQKIKLKFDETSVGMMKALGNQEQGLRKTVLRKPRLFKFLLKPAMMKEPLMLATLTNTITVTNINNPSLEANQIAQEAQVLLDCRLLPGFNEAAFVKNVKKSLKSDKIQVTIVHETPSAVPSKPGQFFQEFKRALLSIEPASSVVPILFPAYSDNSFFRQKGIPVYGINPVHLSMEQLEAVHNSNEYITFDQLEKGRLVYLTFLKNIANTQ
ncbi:MAG: M20/M25/M40 family metallo-hydrolase, partial [Cyclobacteriaceae bacterium]